MTQQRQVPNQEARKLSLEGLRESNRQLDLLNLQLDELIAIIEADLRKQKRERLLKRGKQIKPTIPE
jgi:acetolactate synthase regulatory subunit